MNYNKNHQFQPDYWRINSPTNIQFVNDNILIYRAKQQAQLIILIYYIFKSFYQYRWRIYVNNNQDMKSIIIALMVLALATADSCGGNCPSGKCPTCYCGTTKNMQDIATWCSKYSWNQACCKCIVSHESGGNANALNYNSNSSTDVGLWQINTVNWGQCSGGKAPCDPNANLNCAIKVYGWGGNTWKLWSTHTACGC